MSRRRPRHDRRSPRTPQIEAPAPPQGLDVRIELAGHTVRLEELRAHPERYARWFTQARRSPGHARCLCGRGGERLVIREIAGRYHLARWPNTARDNHHPGCPFFVATESRHSAARSARAAITVTESGTRLAVDYTFTIALPGTDDDPAPEVDEVAELTTGARPQTATVTGLGLLHWLWETAGLNTWRPGLLLRRGWAEVHAALAPALAGLRLGDDPAPRLCHVVAPYHPDRPDPAREARLAEFLRPLEHPEHTVIRGGPRRGQTRQLRHRRLLLGELKDLTATAHGHKLALRHFPRPVFLTGEQRRHLTGRFPAAFSERRGPTARRVLLALVEATPHGYLRLVDAAAMLVDDRYLPADSSHEISMAGWLVAAGREFTKPLRYGGDGLFPDFVLTDTDPPTIVEVFGVTGRESYDARREAKRRHYRDRHIPVIEWTVTDHPPVIPRRPIPISTLGGGFIP